MKSNFRIFALVSLVFCCLYLHATATVSGTIKDPSGAVVPNSFVRFELANTSNNQCSAAGVTLGKRLVDFTANTTTGAIAGTLYRTDTEISCGGFFTSRYNMTIYRKGVPDGPSKCVIVNADFNIASPIYCGAQTGAPALPAPQFVQTNPAGSQTVVQPGGSTFTVNGGFNLTDWTNLDARYAPSSLLQPVGGGAYRVDPIYIDLAQPGPIGTTVPDVGVFTTATITTANTKCQNGICYASQFTGADWAAKTVAACNAANASGGTVVMDFYGAQPASTTVMAIPAKCRVVVPFSGPYPVNVTGGVDAITLGNGSSLTCIGGPPSLSGAGGSTFQLAATANVKSLFAPADSSGHQDGMWSSGCHFKWLTGATVSDSLVRFQGVYVQSGLRDTLIDNMLGIGLHILPGTGAGGGLKITSDLIFDNVQVNGYNNAGARPCVIESASVSGVAGIRVSGGGCQHAGSGQYEVEVNGQNGGSSDNQLSGVTFDGQFHMETSPGSLGWKIRDAQNIYIGPGIESGLGSASAIYTLSESAAGALTNIRIVGRTTSTTSTNWIANSAVGGSNISTAVFGLNLGDYAFKAPGAFATYDTSGNLLFNNREVRGSVALTSATPSTATVTLSGSAVFTSNTNYKCSLTNETTQANPVKITYTDGSHFVITGPNTVTDTIGFRCSGN